MNGTSKGVDYVLFVGHLSQVVLDGLNSIGSIDDASSFFLGELKRLF